MIGFGETAERAGRGHFLVAVVLATLTASCGRTDERRAAAQGGAGAGAEAPGGAGSGAGTTGIVPSEAPPFSIPSAPTSLTLVPCDAISQPEPLGFLPDGRAVVVQRLFRDGKDGGDLVRAWDITTDELETLLVAQPAADIGLADDGARIFESFSLPPAHEPGVRVHTVQGRTVSSSEPMAMTLTAFSGDGNFVLDQNLRRFTLAGELDFDFSAALGEADHALESPVGMSASGDAIATHGYSETGQPLLFVMHDDGSVLALPAEASDLDHCCSEPLSCRSQCGVSFSRDGRYLLSVRRLRKLTVWDLSTETLVLRVDEPSLSSASFAPGSNRLLIATELGVTERNIEGSEELAWRLDGRHPFAIGPEAVLGAESNALVVASREQVLGRWQQPQPTWGAAAVAVTDEAAFAYAADDELPDGFWMMVARYVPDHAGPTATLRAEESQSEWNGQILLSPDEQRVAVVFPDTIRILDATTLEPFVSLPTGAGAIAWSPDGKYLVATPDLHYRDYERAAYVPTKSLTFWSSTSGKLEATYATPTYARSVAFSADGSKVVASGHEIRVPVPDPAGSLTGRPSTQFFNEGAPISFSLDVVTGETSLNDFGELIGWTRELVATERGVFRVSTGEQVSAFDAWNAPDPPVSVVLSPDASLGLAGFPYPQGNLFGVLTGQELIRAGFLSSQMGLAMSRSGGRVMTGSAIYCASSP